MSSPESYLVDPVGDFLRCDTTALDAIFMPKNVAVIGATEKPGSVGKTVLWNLIKNPFGGTVFPVNPNRPSVMGIKAYPNIANVPEKLDLAVVCTPARLIPGIISECVDAGVKAAIIISAGFKELGAPGIELERQVLEQARRGKMRIIGPNCLGVMNPLTGFNATFAGSMARPGNVAFISQSGALCTAVLDWSIDELVGFSAFVSIGSMLDVDWGDLIDYFGHDERTKSIVIYMESIGSARSFLSAAREVAQNKPIIVIKAGRTAAAAKAAASHTGALTGSDEVLDAAFKRAGVLRVDAIADLFNMAEVLGKQPHPKGSRLSILTNAGGPGVLATDALIGAGGELAEISSTTFEALNKFLPEHWSRNNPIDILGDAEPERYAKALEIAAKDPNTDGLLVILTPQDMTDPTATAEALKPYAKGIGKPILASWMGRQTVQPGIDVLNRCDIPTYSYPDTAARAFNYMWQYTKNLRALYETPTVDALSSDDPLPDRNTAEGIIKTAYEAGRTILTEAESKQLLGAYGIPTVQTEIATSVEVAIETAERLGYPVVLKLHSNTITHKTDVGGVKLNLQNSSDVRNAFHAIQKSVTEKASAEGFDGVTVQPMLNLAQGYELIIGASLDVQFGPVLLFGLGGQLVEVFKDRALGLPPLNATLVRRMMEETKVYKALKGVRGRKAIDLVALEKIILRFSMLVVEQNLIKESDINPLFASPERLLALDARFVLHEKDTDLQLVPKPAIKPYPMHYISKTTLKDGTNVTIRPIRPEDEPLMVSFHESLSQRSVYQRYGQDFELSSRIHHDGLTRICFVDYDRRVVLVADTKDPRAGTHRIICVGNLTKIRGTNDASAAVLVSDPYQQRGLGTEMLTRMLAVARNEGIDRIVASIMRDNEHMIKICEKLGFVVKEQNGDKYINIEMVLSKS